jgi:hypothetical protein
MTQDEIKRMENTLYKHKPKEIRMAVLIVNKVDFEARKTTKENFI